MFNFKLYSSNVIVILAIIITKQLTLSVTWPFDSSSVLYYKWSIVTMRLSCTVTEIWRLKCWTDGCTDGRTLSWFYTLSNAIALHWTDNYYKITSASVRPSMRPSVRPSNFS